MIVPPAASSVAPVSLVKPVTGPSQAQAESSNAPKLPAKTTAPAAATKVEPIRYFGGIEGMNATNLIVALQANGTVSGGYGAKAIEGGGTPPPAFIDRGA